MATRIGPASFNYYLNFSDMKLLRTENDMFGWTMPDRRNPRYSYRIVDGMKFIKSYDTVVAAIPQTLKRRCPLATLHACGPAGPQRP